MHIADLIAVLSDPAAYPMPVGAIEVRQTHISAVFLTGEFVYKVKKPVALGFLDFSTLERRRHFCNEEVRLNRRLAPKVYLGVVPITQTGAQLQFEGDGAVVEWAVKMARLPREATLQSWLGRGELQPAMLTTLAERLGQFHSRAAAGEHISSFGKLEVVARNARENFEQSAKQVGATVSQAVHARLLQLTEEALAGLGPLIERRAAEGRPRDTHGDLHLDHVYLFPDRSAPDDLVIIDCIEFNERFRCADPVADMAFLVMDLMFHGRADLARVFADAYFGASGDGEGRALLPFYTAYRAAVRAKVEGMELAEKEIPQQERTAALVRARAHWLLALGQLETPAARPCLVLVAGLPGSGKSTLARLLAEQAGFALIRSDVVRKELAGLPETAPAPAGGGIYSAEWTERTYAECLRRAEALLFEGQRVLVDANFREEARRQSFLAKAAAWGVPSAMLLCQADVETIRTRLQARRDDASDADWNVYVQAAQTWEAPGPTTQQHLSTIATSGSREHGLVQAQKVLRRLGLSPGAGGVP